MQTFLPYPSFTKSLLCLHSKHLGKQRVEAMQILNILEGKTTAWKNHPAVKMWRGYEQSLVVYHNLAIQIWTERGFENNMNFRYTSEGVYDPPWLTEEFCSSHRSKLLFKGSVFGLTDAISKFMKMPYKKWKEQFHLPERNQINHEQRDMLKYYCNYNSISWINWYSQFGWTELDNLPYIWPV